MPPQDFNRDELVVELAALVASAATVTGAATGVTLVWLIKKNWLAACGWLVAGGIIGFAVGWIVGCMLYRAAGNTMVVKVGSGSLYATIPAGLAGGISTAVVVGMIAIMIFQTRGQSLMLLSVSIGFGVVFGMLMACLGSLV